MPRSDERSYASPSAERGHVADAGDGRRDRRPAETGGPLVRLGERPTGQEDGGDRQLVGRQGRAGSRRGGPSSRTSGSSPRGARRARSSDAWVDGIPCREWRSERGSRRSLAGSRVVLRRHVPANVAAFLRWYADPEIARLARYQATPMRPEEIERFFAARVVGPEALAMAVHEKATDRLVGTCAFSQLDGENGSALYHITIGESDAWGHGYGTEATQLMLDHAFGTLGLHRIALYVFEFNERAIRAYKRCGFVVEGRSRESIWRDGRWWDELAMSVLESDWRARREAATAATVVGPDRRPTAADRRAGRGRDRRSGCDGRSGGGDDDPGSGGGRGTGRCPRADRGQGPHGRQRPRGRGAARRGVRGRRPRSGRPELETYLADLMRALEQDDDQKLGGKSAEAARFILRAIDRELDTA